MNGHTDCLFCFADVGDYVQADEVVARIETDKVVVDILASHSGVITKYFAEEGDEVDVGAQFLEIDTDAKAPAAGAAPATPAPPKPEAAATPAPPVSAFSKLPLPFKRSAFIFILCLQTACTAIFIDASTCPA